MSPHTPFTFRMNGVQMVSRCDQDVAEGYIGCIVIATHVVH
jgi:hypothetical protein